MQNIPPNDYSYEIESSSHNLLQIAHSPHWERLSVWISSEWARLSRSTGVIPSRGIVESHWSEQALEVVVKGSALLNKLSDEALPLDVTMQEYIDELYRMSLCHTRQRAREQPGDQEHKADAGKIRMDLLDEGLPNALEGVAAVLSYGGQKYEDHSWRTVPNALSRYKAAAGRHRTARNQGFDFDDESGLDHLLMEICNLMFVYELRVAEDPDVHDLSYNPPPQDHKS